MKLKSIFLSLMLLAVTFSITAQSLTINSHTAEVSSTTKNYFYDMNDLYFIYNSSTSGFEARMSVGKNKIYGGNISTVTISGASTADQKLAFLENSHVKAVSGIYYVLVPKSKVHVLYRTANKRLELISTEAVGQSALWYGHADSLKTATTDTTTALRLAAVRKFNLVKGAFQSILSGGDTPTIAAGAASGSSPTVAITGNAIAGEITLTTGTTALTTGVLATVTLPFSYPNGCYASLTASDADGAVHYNRVFVTSTASTIVLNAAGTALSDATEYKWHYKITGR